MDLLAEKLHTFKTVVSILARDQIAEEIREMLREDILGYRVENGTVTWFWKDPVLEEQKATMNQY